MIYRIFVEKKDNVQARKEQADVKTLLKIDTEDFRLVLRYDVEGMTEEEVNSALGTVFSEPPVDNVYLENLDIPAGYKAFAVSYLSGQYDQRADSCAQCVQLFVSRGKLGALSDDGNAHLVDDALKLLGGKVGSEAGDGLELVDRSARMSKSASAHFGHYTPKRSTNWCYDKGGFVAYTAGAVLVCGQGAES